MNKWLNIKPKVYDFSEDEVDTENESEDDGEYFTILTRIVLSSKFGQTLSIVLSLLILFHGSLYQYVQSKTYPMAAA